MGPIWGRQDPGGPHDGPMNYAIWEWQHEIDWDMDDVKISIDAIILNKFLTVDGWSLTHELGKINYLWHLQW